MADVGVTGLLLGDTVPPESPGVLLGVFGMNDVTDCLSPEGMTQCSFAFTFAIPLPEME